MPREYLFRAKRKLNGQWVYGSLLSVGDDWDMIYPIGYTKDEVETEGGCRVITNTIGQYTGLTDKKGNRIWEGDIVQWGHIEGYKEVEIRIATVKMNPDIQFDSQNIQFPHVFHYGNFAYKNTHEALEVIGSIHDQVPGLDKK